MMASGRAIIDRLLRRTSDGVLVGGQRYFNSEHGGFLSIHEV